MDPIRLLLIEDDPDIGALLGEFLEREGFSTRLLPDGRQAVQTVRGWSPEIVVLDVMLPGEDGFAVCRRIRAESQVPIIMLTARSGDTDRIAGLEIGADDYLGKPFNPRELLARIRAVLRRARVDGKAGEPARRRACAEVVVDFDGRQVATRDGRALALTTAEFDLLACLIERPRRVLSRDQLLDWTRGRQADPYDRTIDVTVSRLRAKLTPAAPQLAAAITTVRNGGYMLALPVEEA
ncbi:MAG TPA: response regulator transcription factor [Devosia sp.]|nr:response regulator transcription factor [Devosia sp.]